MTGRPSSQELAARRHRSEPDYIDRTIETVRGHRDADNSWPQWANIFADEIEDLRADRDALAARLQAAEQALREIDKLDGRYHDLNTARHIARRALEGVTVRKEK